MIEVFNAPVRVKFGPSILAWVDLAGQAVAALLAAKRDLDLMVIDDLSYLPQRTEESEVLFTLIAERYERRSLGITSNLIFTEWEKGVRQSHGDSGCDRQDRASLGSP